VSYSSLASKPPRPKEWRTTLPSRELSQSKAKSNVARLTPSQFVVRTHDDRADWLRETQFEGPNSTAVAEECAAPAAARAAKV